MNKVFETPILLLLFNRPEETALLWEKIKEIKPKNLYIAADGPRPQNQDDQKNCATTRKIITEGINWDCKLHFLFRDENLGCGVAIQSAISWFFEQAPEGIILEDDCLPHEDFFDFCEKLLERYRNEKKVFMISGSCTPGNFQMTTSDDYLFTYVPSAWGWATWRRSWNKYDFGLAELDNFEKEKIIVDLFPQKKHQQYWLNFFHEIKNKKINNWDYQLAFTSFKERGLCIRPKNNLVQNLGTTTINGKIKSIQTTSPLRINKHPIEVAENKQADEAIMKELTAPLHQLKFILKKIGIFYILKNIHKNL
jgi:hypothetical protein